MKIETNPDFQKLVDPDIESSTRRMVKEERPLWQTFFLNVTAGTVAGTIAGVLLYYILN